MKDFFFFFLLGWGFGGRGHKPFPPIGQSRGEDSRDLFFLPYPYNRETDIQEKLPEGFRRVHASGYPIFIGGPGTGYILS